jgi:dipeptidyl aminopeptidase/acylaminoacyl peptidase
LSNDAVVEFLGGVPDRLRDHYHEASPAELAIHCRQLLIHGTGDDTVPVQMSRDYVKQKQQKHENVSLLEIPKAGHLDIIDPESKAWPLIEKAVTMLV